MTLSVLQKNRPYGITIAYISVRAAKYFLICGDGSYTVPEITSVLTPGLIPHAPVTGSWV